MEAYSFQIAVRVKKLTAEDALVKSHIREGTSAVGMDVGYRLRSYANDNVGRLRLVQVFPCQSSYQKANCGVPAPAWSVDDADPAAELEALNSTPEP